MIDGFKLLQIQKHSISTTLEEDVVTTEQAHKVLLALTDSVTARMRSDNVKAFCVAVSIRSNDFKTRSHQKKLMDPTDISTEVYMLTKQLFAELSLLLMIRTRLRHSVTLVTSSPFKVSTWVR